MTPGAAGPAGRPSLQEAGVASYRVVDPDLPGVTDHDLPGITDPDLPGVTDHDLPGITDHDLPGITDPDLRADASTAITLLATLVVNAWTASRRPPSATFCVRWWQTSRTRSDARRRRC